MELRIGILCSGGLGLSTLRTLSKNFSPQFIFTDLNSIGIIEFAKTHSIPHIIGNPRKFDPRPFLKQFKTDVIFSINYLFIVEDSILKHPQYAINLHGSLLPKYRGRTPHVWAIINGEKQTGITAHIMEAGCDTGDIVLQQPIDILWEYTGADILQKYETIYPQMVLDIIDKIEKNKLDRVGQDDSKATFFGKRTPDDGEIDWNWQKERIYNWIRAQANPYPGAYTFINGEKVIIDKISFSDYGFEDSIPNGTILKSLPELLIKTPNGVIELIEIRNKQEFLFEPIKKFEHSCK